MSANGHLFPRLVQILLPKGGFVAALAEAYFDESESNHDNIFCVAGYTFRSENALALQTKWTEVLRREGIDYLHMKDFAPGNGEFKRFPKPERVRIQIELYDLLKAHMSYGYSVSFDLRFRHMMPSARMHGINIVSPYSMCCYFAMMSVRSWAEREAFDGKIAYFFESGHSDKAEASRIMNDIFGVPELRAYYRHGSHSFVSKEDAVLLQCADILAWQWRKNVVERIRGNMKPRADLFSLLEKPHFTTHLDEKAITDFVSLVREVNARSGHV